MRIVITGADGFIGKNLQLHLAERKDVQVVCFTRSHGVAELPDLLQGGGLCVSLGRCQSPVTVFGFLFFQIGPCQAAGGPPGCACTHALTRHAGVDLGD